MTKEVPQRRGTVSSGGSQGSRKLSQEVSIVKHYQPNSARKYTTNFPEVKAFQDFPTTTRYLQLNPVFKLVDNYLASKQPACGHGVNGAYPTPVKNCRCSCMRYVQGDTTLKNYTTKKSPVPVAVGNCPHKNRVRLCANSAKIRANLHNINSKTNVRVSLKNGYVLPCEAPAPVVNVGQCSVQPNYVEQLKTEIKNCRMAYCGRTREDPDYVSKLKDEIIVNKSQCINEARAIINELKNEILNFRLRPKVKYSSSCSNLHAFGDNAAKTASTNLVLQKSKESPEKIYACAAKQATCCPSPGKEKAADLERLRPFETLWRTSRGSFASSSDMDAVSLPSPGVNFEQKLEEANSLIEKVRKALKDMGKGIQHKPPDRRKFFDINEPIEECSNDSKCINMVCSFHGTCCSTTDKTAAEDKIEKNLPKPTDVKKKEQEEELQKQKEEAMRKQLEEQLRKQIKDELAKEKADELLKRLEEQSRGQTDKVDEIQKRLGEQSQKGEESLRQTGKEAEKRKVEELVKKKENQSKEKDAELVQSAPKNIDSVDKESGGQFVLGNVNPSSMDQLHKRLKAICELSSESHFDPSQMPPVVPEECPESEEESKDDSIPKSISDVITDSESTVVNSDESPETVDAKLESNACCDENLETVDTKITNSHTKLPWDDDGKNRGDFKDGVESEAECCEGKCHNENVKFGNKNGSSDSRFREKSLSKEGLEERKGSNRERKSSRSCEFEDVKGSTEDFELRRDRQESRSHDVGLEGRMSKQDFENRDLETRRSSSKQGSGSKKSSKSYDYDSEGQRWSREDKVKGSMYAFEGRRRTKPSTKLDDTESEERKRSREESTKSCEFKNLKLSTEDFDAKRSSKSYGAESDDTRRSKESKFSRSYDFGNIHNSSDDFEEKKAIEIEGRKGSKQSKSKTSTEASSTKSGKLSIQVMPPVNIRGGLVMQRTLNLCIKPTGSSANVIVGEHPNVGYREVKTKCEKEEEPLKDRCPEECSDLEHHCKYRVLGTILGPRKSKSETIDTDSSNAHKVDPQLINALNENALLLYKSYQILDNKYQPANVASTSSLAMSKMAKNIAETRKSITSHIGRKQKVLDKTEENVIKQVLEHGKTPWEIGFYQTKATQCSGTSLDVPRESSSSDEVRSEAGTSQVEVMIPPIYEECESEVSSLASQPLAQEEPVKDDSPVVDESSIETPSRVPNMNLSEVINALKGGVNAEVQKLLMEKLQNYDTSDQSMHSRRSLVVLDTPPIGAQSPLLKFEPLTDSDLERRGPRKSILSNRISLSDMPPMVKKHEKKSVSSSSSSTSTAEDDDLVKASAALIAADTKIPKKVDSLSSSTTTTSGTSSSYNIHGSLKESIDPSEQIGSLRLPMKESALPIPIIEQPEAGAKPEQKMKEKEGNMDKNLQASSAATSTSETSETDSTYTHSRERMNTITCFIKGLTGTSQEQLDKLRSNPSFPKTDLKEWSTTQMRTLDSQHHDSGTKENDVMSKRSIYEVTLEEIMDSHEYGDKNDEDRTTFAKDKLSESTDLSDKAKKKRVKDFQTFAKETIIPTTAKKGSASSKSHKKKSSAIVMTMTEERDKFEGGDECTEGAFTNFTRRDLPFYRRVLGRVVDPATRQPMDMAQSDPIPLDDSVSEGEIKCKCSVSIGEVHPCKYSFDKWTSGAKQLKKHLEDPIRKDFGDKSLRISRQRTQYNNWVAFYLQKRKPVVFNDSSSTSPINSSDR